MPAAPRLAALLLGPLMVIGLLLGLASPAEAQSRPVFPDQAGIGAAPDAAYIDLFFELGVATEDIVFPAARSGTSDLTYSLADRDHSLESLGFSFDPDTRIFKGTPTLAGAGRTKTGGFVLTYWAKNRYGSARRTVYVLVCEGGGSPDGAMVCTPPAFVDLGFAERLAGQSYTVGTAITDLTLPAATGGTGTTPRFLYTLTGPAGTALPAGLSFDEDSRTLSGMPTAAATTELTYSVQDAASAEEFPQDFTVTVNADVALTAPPDQGYTVNTAVDVTLPEATGGTGDLTYTLTGTLPAGLSFKAASRTLTGTPGTVAITVLTYTVTDANGATASQTVTVTVNDGPALNAPPAQSYTVDTAVDVTLPEATGGTGDLTYTLTGTLPAGLSFKAANRTLTGTPGTVAITELTYTVTDDNGATATAGFTVTVNAGVVLTEPTAPPAKSYTADTLITPLVLSAATGGTGDLTYTLTGPAGTALPAGLSFDEDSRTLSGMPTAAAITELTYTVTDANAATASQKFIVTVNAGLELNSPGAQGYTLGTTITDLILPEATGGTGDLTYDLTGPGGDADALPDGLDFNAGTRTLSGTPTTAGVTVLTYTVTDANDASISQTFTVTVNNRLGLRVRFSGSGYYGPSMIGITINVNTIIAPLVLQAATGGTAPLSYTLTRPGGADLPAGLSFDAASRTLSGTPTEVASATTLTHTVTDANGATATADYTFTVLAPLVLTDPDDQNYTVDTAVYVTLPSATGATAPLSYTLRSALPDGLIFDADTRTLSGTPTTAGVTVLTYAVTDANKVFTSYQTFTVTVNNRLGLRVRFSGGGFTMGVNTTVALVLQAATGGTAPLSYTLTRPGGAALPAGLSFDAASRTLSGTPTEVASATTLTHTVTDANGATATADFTFTVHAPLVLPDPDDQNYPVDTAITALELPVATGATAPLSYTLIPLPPGLIFDADSRTLSGTPTTVGVTVLTYTVTDANEANTSRQTFTVIVAATTPESPVFSAGTVTDTSVILSWYAVDNADSYTLTRVVDGGADVVVFSGNALTATDTGLTPGAPYKYVVTATNSAGTSANSNEVDATTLATAAAPPLTLPAPFPRGYTMNVNTTIALVLPIAFGGAAPLRYALTGPEGGDLPKGLIFTPGTRTLSGTPTEVASATTLTYTVTDANDASISQTFTFTVLAPLVLPDPDDQFYPVDTAIAALTLPEATGGSGDLTYTLTGTLPAGLSFDAASRRLSGTPTTVTSATTLTYTVTDANDASISQTFTVIVAAATPESPVFSAGTVTDTSVILSWYAVDNADSYTLTRVVDGGADVVVFSGNALTATDTGLTPGAPYKYVVTATNSAGTSANSNEVDATTLATAAAPPLTLPAPFPRGYTMNVNTTIALVLPIAFGGAAPLRYALTGPEGGDLPKGLIFTPGTRTLSGTPTEVASATTLTYTVTDANDASISQTFTFTVLAPLVLPDPDDQFYPVDTAITALELPVATGSSGSLSYTLTGPDGGALPAGLTFDADSRTLSGTPTEAGVTELTYTVTDDNGASTSQTFTVIVAVAATRLESPVFFAGTVTDISITLSWYAVDNADSYTLTRVVDGGADVVVFSGNALTATDTGLTPETPYKYVVTATSSAGTSANSGEVDLTTNATPGPAPFLLDFAENATGPVATFTSTATGNRTIEGFTLGGTDAGHFMLEFIRESTSAEGVVTFKEPPNFEAPADANTDNRYEISITSTDSDGETSAATMITIRVTDAEDPGSVNAITGNAQVGMTLTAGDTVTDEDSVGAITGYQWQRLPSGGGVPINIGDDQNTYEVVAADAGSVIGFDRAFTLRVVVSYTDGFGSNTDQATSAPTATVIAALALPAQANQRYTVDTEIAELELPKATGGIGDLTYALTGPMGDALPAGLSFNAASRRLTGTPTALATTILTYTVTDSAATPVVATQDFTVTVTVLAPLVLPDPDDQNYTVDTAVYVTLPSATGGIGEPTYTLTGPGDALPAGLSFNPASRTLSGTPTAAATTILTYTVTDSATTPVVATQDFTVTVNDALALTRPPIQDTSYTVGTAVDVTLPEATGGTGELTYTLTGSMGGALPAGLIFNAVSRTLSGTPTVRDFLSGAYYMVTDANGANTTIFFIFSVFDDVELPMVDNQRYTVGTAVDVTLPKATGGRGRLSYALTGPGDALPAGLIFDAASRRLTGTPTEVASVTTLTYTVTGVNGATSQIVTVTVNADVTLTQPPIQSYTVGTAVDVTLPKATGGSGRLSYALTGPGDALPAGLIFDAASRRFTGTPTEVASVTTLTYTVTDVNDASISQTFTVTVNADVTLTELTPPPAQSYTVDTAIDALVLSAATGGTAPLTYALTGPNNTDLSEVPGLTFTAASRRLTGTPTAVTSATTLTYTVTDTNDATASQTFTVTVNDGLVLTTAGDQGYQGYTVDTAVDVTLPAATGGTAPLTYALTNLPTGLSFDAASRKLTGSPTAVTSATTLTYTVTDANGATTSQTFTVTVAAATLYADSTLSALDVSAGILNPTFDAATDAYAVSVGTDVASVMVTPTTTDDGAAVAVSGVAVASGQPSEAIDLNVGNNIITILVVAEDGVGEQTYTVTVARAVPPPGIDLGRDTARDGGTNMDRITSDRSIVVTLHADFQNARDTWEWSSNSGNSYTTGSNTGRSFDLDVAQATYNDNVVRARQTVNGVVSEFAGLAMFQHDTVKPTISLNDGGTSVTITKGDAYNDPVTADDVLDGPIAFSNIAITGGPVDVDTAGEYTLTYNVMDRAGNAADPLTRTVTVSEPVAATRPEPTVLSAGTITDTSIALSWDAVTNAESYTLTRVVGGADVVVFSGNALTATDTGLTPETSYKYVVTATNSAGTSADSNEVDATTLATLGPAPFLITVDENTTRFVASFTATATGTRTITGFNLGGDDAGHFMVEFIPGRRLSRGVVTFREPPNFEAPADANTDNRYEIAVTATDDSIFDDNLAREVTIRVTDAEDPGSVSITGNAQVGMTLTATVTDEDSVGAISGYQWQRLPSGGGVPINIGDDQNTYEVVAADAGDTLRVVVSYTDGFGSNTDEATSAPTATVTAPLALPAQANQSYTVDTEIAELELPKATGGTGALTYALTGPGDALPAGLSFNAASRRLTGTPTALATTILTYTVTDSAATPVVATQDFTVTVNAPLVLPDPDDQNYTVDTAVDVTLPAATGGIGEPTYTLTGPGDALPAGLSFNPASRTLSGTPTAAATTILTYTVTDSATTPVVATQDFTVTVNADVTLTELTPPPAQSYTVDTAIDALVLSAATGGTAPLTYALTGPNNTDLSEVPGLTFTAASRRLTGTPTAVTSATTLTYTVTDANGATASQTFTVTVNDGLVLTTAGDQGYTVDTAIDALVLPAASGGTAPLRYTLTNLPDGLDFTAGSRTLSGTPTAAAITELTYTVTDANDASISQTFTVTVNADVTLTELTPPPAQSYTVDTAIDALVLSAATGGTAPLTYALTGPNNTDLSEVPGLTFTAASRRLTGTPTAVTSATTLTYTVTDTNDATASQTFTVTVNDGLVLTTAGDQGYQGYTVGHGGRRDPAGGHRRHRAPDLRPDQSADGSELRCGQPQAHGLADRGDERHHPDLHGDRRQRRHHQPDLHRHRGCRDPVCGFDSVRPGCFGRHPESDLRCCHRCLRRQRGH